MKRKPSNIINLDEWRKAIIEKNRKEHLTKLVTRTLHGQSHDDRQD